MYELNPIAADIGVNEQKSHREKELMAFDEMSYQRVVMT